MSWRFRKTFRVFPGLKLNLTRNGLSATVGASPLSVNVGPRGIYQNVDIPGTGIWDRQRLDSPSPEDHQKSTLNPNTPSPSLPVPQAVTYGAVEEIRSASIEMLKSQSMAELQSLLEEGHSERETLQRELAAAKWRSKPILARFQSWDSGFFLKRLFAKSFIVRKELAETAQAEIDELEEQLRLTVLATQIDIDREQAEPYYRMRDAFAAMSESQMIWDTLERHAVNRVAERTSAYQRIKREPVGFGLGSCDLLQWEQKVLHLPNRTGGELFLYPGFGLYRAAKNAFAIIDIREIRLASERVNFIEDGQVPSDATIVDHTWAKCNKDGSPDRRFRDNYKIPVASYGSLKFTSHSGLHEEYYVSNRERGEEFARAWNAVQDSFSPAITERRRNPKTSKTRPAHTPEPVVNQSGETPTDLVTAYVNETDRARTLATERGEFWEFLLCEELLRARIGILENECAELDQRLANAAKVPVAGAVFIAWLQGRIGELQRLREELASRFTHDLKNSWGQSGIGADPIAMINAANSILECCQKLLTWELEVCLAKPPVKLRKVGMAFRGITAATLQDLKKVPLEIARGVESFRTGNVSVSIDLNLLSPPQLAKAQIELEKVIQHPEWMTK